MFRCTGICSKCGRCKDFAMMSGSNDRKAKLLTYPSGFEPDEGDGLGIAVDIGTTTVVGVLWDLKEGIQIATSAKTNPQREFGLDVISRITYCDIAEENLKEIQSKTTECIEDIVETLCKSQGRDISEISKIAVCGNTTMEHFFAGYSPKSLATAPFAPAYTGTLHVTARDMGLTASDKKKVLPEDTEVFVLPNIAGHVGGDITAGIVATRLTDMKGVTVFIDIGTNGEIVISDGNNIFACSTAAGPAFEGVSIKYGMRATAGAIEKIKIQDGEVYFTAIGEEKSSDTYEIQVQGICGSGIIDAIAQMLEANIIDETGRLAAAYEAEKKGFDSRLCEGLVERDGERQFIVVAKDFGEDIVITQKDIREIQLAKGAIKAGIEIMLGHIGKTAGDIDRIIIGGAFGNYIDKESAVRIGILPDIQPKKIIPAGNTAGVGVSMALVSRKELELAGKIPHIVKHVELAEEEKFQTTYINSMNFPLKNNIVAMDIEQCCDRAVEIFLQESGCNKCGEKYERMRKEAFEIRRLIEPKIDIKGIYSVYDSFKITNRILTVGGETFDCPAFQQIEPESVEKVIFYAVTAGDYDLEEVPVIRQLYADIWGISFVDALRKSLMEELQEKYKISDSFGPGFYGMALEEMNKMPAMVNFEAVGVKVNENSLLKPIKSCAGILFAVNERYRQLDSACRMCLGNKESCSLCGIIRGN